MEVSAVEVFASGGVIWRSGDDGDVEVLLVHRPAYDDWTFPKGKRRRDESDEACAVREVEEETGYRCVLGHELTPTSYVDRRGRAKRVRYWEMAVAAHTPRTHDDEVDEQVWLPLGDADRLLSYDRDRIVLVDFACWAGAAAAR